MAEIDIGTLYDVNRALIAKRDKMPHGEMIAKMNEIGAWFSSKVDSHYYMLLCRELYDYTVFHILDSHYYEITQDLLEVIESKGEVLSIDYSHEFKCYEVWIKPYQDILSILDEKDIDDKPYVYMLFDYTDAIVEG